MTDLEEALAPVNAIRGKLVKMWGWKHTEDGVEAWMMKTQDYEHLVQMLRDAEAFMDERLKLCKAANPFELQYPEE